MRNISFSLTTPQFIAGTKTVTRRFGWWQLKPGDRLMAVEKAMGLKRGEKVKKLGIIEIVSVRKERLDAITDEDCEKEGFPDWIAPQFIDFLSGNRACEPYELVNRIEFKKVTG